MDSFYPDMPSSDAPGSSATIERSFELYGGSNNLEDFAFELFYLPENLDPTNYNRSNVTDITPAPFTVSPSNPSPPNKDSPTPSMGPPLKKRKSKAPTLRATNWEPYKAEIIELHISRKPPLSLRQVKGFMEEKHRFRAEVRQYRTRISQWGMDKNIKPEEMRAVVRKRQARKLDETKKNPLHITIRGTPLEPGKIDGWMKRNNVAENSLYAPSPAADTPAAVSCWTASSAPTPASHHEDFADKVGEPSQPAHPVVKNYRKVHVTIIHYEVDRLGSVVDEISKLFRDLYQYEVREFALAIPAVDGMGLSWPWPEESSVHEKDLQIIYYLGGTTKESVLREKTRLEACPFQHLSDQSSPHPNWLEILIGIPRLTSDVLIILDCYVEGVSKDDTVEYSLPHLMDDDYAWARMAVVFAGYTQRTSPPGGFSRPLVSLLKVFAQSFAGNKLLDSQFVFSKLNQALIGEPQIRPEMWGNDGMGSIVLSPLNRT